MVYKYDRLMNAFEEVMEKNAEDFEIVMLSCWNSHSKSSCDTHKRKKYRTLVCNEHGIPNGQHVFPLL